MRTKTVVMCCLFAAGSLCLFAAASPSPQEPAKKWPKDRTEAQGAVDAFTAALTQSGYDHPLRGRLKASPESARDAVSDPAIGNIEIPKDILLIFHEPETCKDIYPFYLPKPGETVTNYTKYFQGCRSKFQLYELTGPIEKTVQKKSWNGKSIGEAFTAALKRSTRDKNFRNRLLGTSEERGSAKALASAKQAVIDEGNIDIPSEVVIFFHENESNEKYHMFTLPPFSETEKTPYFYRDQFDGFYFVW